jgi:acetoacetyl-CoA reductase
MKRIAVVTGGTRGIGAAISIALKKQGHKVIATYLSNADAAKEFEKENGIITKAFDVSNFEACHEHVEKISHEHGQVDILVNNAGITKDTMLHKMDVDQWNDVIATNLNSCFNMSRAVIESMRARGFGRIINISSINGQKGQAGQCNYAAAKAGLIGFTRALAQESGAKGITVNVIAPGYVDTDMVKAVPPHVLAEITNSIPMKRLATAQEIADAVVYLTSNSASFITGSTLSINGGLYFS